MVFRAFGFTFFRWSAGFAFNYKILSCFEPINQSLWSIRICHRFAEFIRVHAEINQKLSRKMREVDERQTEDEEVN